MHVWSVQSLFLSVHVGPKIQVNFDRVLQDRTLVTMRICGPMAAVHVRNVYNRTHITGREAANMTIKLLGKYQEWKEQRAESITLYDWFS